MEYAIVTGIPENLARFPEAVEKEPPDVLVTHLRQFVKTGPDFPQNKKKEKEFFYNGISFCEDVKADYPHIKIIVLTGYNDWTTVRRMLDMGVAGYVLKTSPLYEVLNAIDSVMDGNIYLCKKSTLLLRKEIKEHFFWVTVGEQKLLRQMAEGLTNKEIADKLYLAHETIKSKRKFLIQKFGSEGSINMLKKAMQMGLIWEDFIP